jgi:hypothetical protein
MKLMVKLSWIWLLMLWKVVTFLKNIFHLLKRF